MTHSLLTLSYCRCDPFGSAHFSTRTADAKFQIMWTFSSNHTHCPLTVDVALLILYTFSQTGQTSVHTAQLSLGTAHFLSAYCRCGIPHTADFLLTPHTLFFFYRCFLFSFPVFLLQMFPSYASCTLSSCCKISPRTADLEEKNFSCE